MPHQWFVPPQNLELNRQEIHVWRASLELSPIRLQKLKQFLPTDEAQRSDRFYFEKDHNYFVAAHGLLRFILSRYYMGEIEPHQIRFIYNPYGKPFLSPKLNLKSIQFNMSHSRGMALYGFSIERKVGIDLEYIDPKIAYEEIAVRFFSKRESQMLQQLPPETRRKAFFSCWTRKEAYIKARGKGLSLPLDQFDVSVAPDEPAQLLETRSDPQEVNRWILQALFPDPAYAAALAVEGDSHQLKCWQVGKVV